MARSEQAIMLGSLSTVPVESEYVAGLLQEVKVLLTEAVAGSTAKGYANHWKRWLAFLEEHNLVHIPAYVDHLCAFFYHFCSLSLTPCLQLSPQGRRLVSSTS